MKKTLGGLIALVLCAGSLAGAEEYTITEEFTVTGFEVGNTIDNIQITAPKCLTATAKTINHNSNKIDHAIDEAGNYSLYFEVSSTLQGDCGSNGDAVSLRMRGRHIHFTVNGHEDSSWVTDGSELPVMTVEYWAYTVDFVDYVGNGVIYGDGLEDSYVVRKRQLVGKGRSATPPADPAHKGLTFKGWEGAYNNVTTHKVVKATYGIAEIPEYVFTVTGFEFGKSTSDVKVKKMPSGCFSATTSFKRNGHEFEGTIDGEYNYGISFDVNVSDEGGCADDSLVNILKFTKLNEEHVNFTVNGSSLEYGYFKNILNGHMEYSASTIKFVDYDGTILKQELVAWGKSATAPEIPVHEGLTFKKWNGDFSNVSVPITITAVYEENPQSSSSSVIAESSSSIITTSSSSVIAESSSSGYDINKIPEIAFTITGLEVGKMVKDIKVKTPNDCFSVAKMTLRQDVNDTMQDISEGPISAALGALLVDISVSDTGTCANDDKANVWRYFAEGSEMAEIYTVNGKKGSISSFEHQVTYRFSSEELNPNSSSSSAKDEKSSSSSKKDDKESIFVSEQLPQFSVVAANRSIEIAGARVGSVYAVLDLQGRVIKLGRVQSANFNVPMSRAATYLVRVGDQTQSVTIK